MAGLILEARAETCGCFYFLVFKKTKNGLVVSILVVETTRPYVQTPFEGRLSGNKTMGPFQVKKRMLKQPSG